MSGNALNSAASATDMTTTTAFDERTRGVYIGVSQSLDFSFDGTNWVLFKDCAAGSIIPIQVVAVRKNAASAACDSGDCIFLY